MNNLFDSSNLLSQFPVDFTQHNTKCEVYIKRIGVNLIRAEWRTSDGGRCALTLGFTIGASLLKSFEADTDLKGPLTIITTKLILSPTSVSVVELQLK
jgi:hypothetical protein